MSFILILVEADIQLNSTLEKRGYSASELVTKEKPSSLLKKIEIGTNYMKEYLAETMDGYVNKFECHEHFLIKQFQMGLT